MIWAQLQEMGAPELALGPEEAVCAYLIDLDRFKAINDVLGYVAGDEVLRVTEGRIAAWAGPRGFLSRVSGDMFGVIRPVLAGDVTAGVGRLRAALAEPIRVGDQLVTRSVSIGLAFGRLDDVTVRELFQRADDAMESAQASGGDAARAFTEDLNSRAVTRSQIELHLRNAVRNRSLTLHFQPEVDLRTGTLVAVEALMRWQHPTLGLLSAESFIGIAEQSGVISDLGAWSLDEACRQRAAWQADYPDLPVVMRVNMSPTQLSDPHTPALFDKVLRDSGLRGDQLCIEITELVEPPDQTQLAGVLHQIRRLGVTVALDDFGAGYSSLIRLKALPVDVLKIDRELITDLGSHAAGTTIVKTVVGLAAALGLQVVAEGVESAEVAAELLRIGCWRGQGHLLGSAMPAEALRPVLAAGRVVLDIAGAGSG